MCLRELSWAVLMTMQALHPVKSCKPAMLHRPPNCATTQRVLPLAGLAAIRATHKLLLLP